MSKSPLSMIHRSGTVPAVPPRRAALPYLRLKTKSALPAGKCSTSGHSAG
jgi:hypothetical protein